MLSLFLFYAFRGLGDNVGDVRYYYVPAGESYVEGVDPSVINWEHPPLAKYIIGFSMLLFSDVKIVSMVFALIGLLFLLLIVKIVFNKFLALFTVLLIVFDGTFIMVSTSGILDVFMLTFTVVAVYFLTRYFFLEDYRLIIIFMIGLFSGLSVACKWSLIPLLFMVFTLLSYFTFKRDHLSGGSYTGSLAKISIFIVTMSSMYLLSYIMFFIHGNSMFDFLVLQAKMVSYHRSINAPTLWTSMNGLLKLFSNLAVFKAFYVEEFLTTTKNATPYIYAKEAEYAGIHVYLYLGLGGLARLFFIPSFIYVLSKFRKVQSIERIRLVYVLLLALSSMLICLSSNLDWYIYDTLPFWYMLVGATLFSVENVKLRKFLMIILFSLNAVSIMFLKLECNVIDFFI